MPSRSETVPTISFVLIVRNERHNIQQYFKSIEGVADELVIVDTGSTDGTIECIESLRPMASFKVQLVQEDIRPFHFGKAKNSGIARASGDYIFLLDADERLTPSLRESLKVFLTDRDPLLVCFNRVDELVPHFIDPCIRLFKNNLNIRYGEDDASLVDEILQFQGEVLEFDQPILHYQGINHLLRRPQRNLFQLELDVNRTNKEHGTLRELFRGFASFMYIFRKIYFRRKAWKDGKIGFKYALLRAWYKFLVHFFIAMKPTIHT